MKKLLYCAVALAMTLFAGSCQKENLEQVKGGKTISFTVAAPGQIQTKAIADGMNVDVLHYEVYSREKGAPNQLEIAADSPLAKGHVNMTPQQDPKFPNDPEKVINTATVELDLLKDQDLTIIFWAQVKGAGYYNVTTDGSTDLRKISFKPNKDVYANVEARAAFYKRVDFNTDNNLNYEVELVRPFAQLNLGTTKESLNPVQPGQTIGYSIDVLKSEVTVKGICTSFNTVTGLGENENEDVVYVLNDTPYQQTKNDSEPEVLTVQDKPYHYVSMNYLFVPGGDKLVEVSYTVKTDKGDIQNTIKNVPVKQNFRTNIIGNLLTSKTKFDIVVDEEFKKPDIDLEYKADGLVQVNPDLDATATSYTKMYEISSANGFAYAMMNIVDNMEAGESAEFYLISSIDMKGINYVPPTVKTGVDVLLATGAAPMTRAASEITISGLDSPIFEKVANGAAVTFSDIVVEDHESDAALVNEVETGADVVVNNCSASDSADKDVYLIGTGEMVDIKDGVSTVEQLQAALRTSANTVRVNAALTVAAGQDIVLDLNRKLVQYVLEPDKTDIMFRVNGKLTITGNGQINSNHYIASANAGGEIKVENGGFTAETTCFQANGGKVLIYDGHFSVKGNYGSTYLLNHVDSKKNEGLIVVSGGVFVGYNPAKSASESPVMNFVAEEYVSVETEDNVWTVRPDLYKENDTYFAYTSNGFQKALRLNEPYVEIALVDDVTVDVAAWDHKAFGGDKSEIITIYGKKKKGETPAIITFNQTNSDWNNIATNNNAKLIIYNANITSTGYNDGPWNRHDLNFACDVELGNVTSDKAIALKAGGTLTSVNINDKNTSDTYALWIQPNGQTVTLDGCTIDMIDCSDGRGIKIDEQYVDNPGRVTLNVSNTTFKTEEKAAILVKSTAGADVNLNGINISEVKADSKNAVWVDADSAAYYDKVTVTGGTKIQEK